MRNSYPNSIDSLFINAAETDYTSISKIQQHVIILLKLNRAVYALLPEILRPWCRVANIRQGVMVLETANASWQMRLRYEKPQLLSALRTQILSSLSSIDITINPDLTRKQELNLQNNDRYQQHYQQFTKNKRQLSLRSAASIRHVAKLSEGKLKNVLERLAKLAEKSTDSGHSREIDI